MRRRLSFLLCLPALFFLATGCRNKPPYTPAKPQGPSFVPKDSLVEYSTITTDPNRDRIFYIFDWGDSRADTTLSLRSGDTARARHAWSDTGIFAVRVRARDARGLYSSSWSETLLVQVGRNRRPLRPAPPTGPDSGAVDSSYSFTAMAIDPDGDSVRIRFIWGEQDRVSYWSELVPSGTPVTESVIYYTGGIKRVRVVAMDQHSGLSDTSEPKLFAIRNTPPQKPTLDGPARGIKNGPYYTFYATCRDPQQDSVQYKFFWGNGTTSGWTPLLPSGAVAIDSCRYAAEGVYSYRVLARDQYGAYSETSDVRQFEVVGEGQVLWHMLLGDDIVSSPALGEAVDAWGRNRTAVVAAAVNGTLVAVDAYQGRVLYEAYEPEAEQYYCSPAIGPTGTVYIGNGNGLVYAYDRSGILKWAWPGEITGDDMYATPAVDNNNIYVGGENRSITQIRDLGDTAFAVWSYRLREELNASPVINSNGELIVCDDSGYVYCFAPDRSLRWSHTTFQNITSSPALAADGTIYFGTEQGALYALSPNGERVWPPYVVQPSASITSSPVVGPDGTIYFGADNGYLYRLTPSGQPVNGWPVQLCLSDIASTPAIAADGIVYVAADNDTMYAVRPDGSVAWSVSLRLPGRRSSPRHKSVDDLLPSPVIDRYGIVYVASGLDGLLAIAGRSSGSLAPGQWPMFHRDQRHSGKQGNR